MRSRNPFHDTAIVMKNAAISVGRAIGTTTRKTALSVFAPRFHAAFSRFGSISSSRMRMCADPERGGVSDVRENDRGDPATDVELPEPDEQRQPEHDERNLSVRSGRESGRRSDPATPSGSGSTPPWRPGCRHDGHDQRDDHAVLERLDDVRVVGDRRVPLGGDALGGRNDGYQRSCANESSTNVTSGKYTNAKHTTMYARRRIVLSRSSHRSPATARRGLLFHQADSRVFRYGRRIAPCCCEGEVTAALPVFPPASRPRPR